MLRDRLSVNFKFEFFVQNQIFADKISSNMRYLWKGILFKEFFFEIK